MALVCDNTSCPIRMSSSASASGITIARRCRHSIFQAWYAVLYASIESGHRVYRL
jgi:hypothetical protein